jgi:hypothetical protein
MGQERPDFTRQRFSALRVWKVSTTLARQPGLVSRPSGGGDQARWRSGRCDHRQVAVAECGGGIGSGAKLGM